jgi:Transmembrane secretion effector
MRTPALAIPLGMMAVVGTLGYNFQVILPLLARFTFDGGAPAYTALAVAMGAGSVLGALVAGARGRVGPGLLVGAALGFGAAALIASAAPTLPLEAMALIPLGAASVTFAAGINSSLQLAADPAMRGRVMALGSTPVGGPITGYLSEAIGPRAGLVLAGAAGLVAAIGARAAFGRAGNHSASSNAPSPVAAGVDGRRASDRVRAPAPESA